MNRRTLITTLLSGLSAGVAAIAGRKQTKLPKWQEGFPVTSRNRVDAYTHKYNLKVDSLGINTRVASFGYKDDYETIRVGNKSFDMLNGRDWDIKGIDQESAEKLLTSMAIRDKIKFEITNGLYLTSFSGYLSMLSLDCDYGSQKFYKAVITDA